MESLFLYKISFVKQHSSIAFICHEQVFSYDFFKRFIHKYVQPISIQK